jgi:hypothetical protein
MANNGVDVIDSVTVSGAYTSTINFDLSSVTVSDYRFFRVQGYVKSNWTNTPSRGNGHDFILQQFNGDSTTSNYSWCGLLTDTNATGSTFQSYLTDSGNGQRFGRVASKGKTYNATSDCWSIMESYITVTDTNYETTGQTKLMTSGSWISDGFNSGSYDGAYSLGGFWWNNTAVLTAITYDLVNSYFTADSKLTLYGFKNTA